ncbi:MAG: hypothetical protein E2O85_05965 [Bacteroidetes bacterium]|nr:MAG: hypothetical protein E2O85_05965 [Bacteroidota bacterium]
MDQVLRYSIPVIHPIAVHFPFVLVLLGLGFGLVWLFRDRIQWLATASYIQILGLAGAIVAYRSGAIMKEQSEGVPIVEELVHLHEDAALMATWAIGLSVVALLGARYLHRMNTSHPGTMIWARVAVVFIQLVAAALVVWTAHIGGTMVWGVIS